MALHGDEKRRGGLEGAKGRPHAQQAMATCASCGEENPKRAKYCLSCGTALQAAPLSAAEERKVVTVLFCDLVGFTRASDRADPEDVRARWPCRNANGCASDSTL